MIRFTLALLAAVIAPSFAARAQLPVEQSDDGADDFCILTLRLWTGSREDIQAIERIPVPASFQRLLFDRGRCPPGFRPRDLVHWHFRFGTEASTRSAIEFIDRHPPRSDDVASRRLYAASLWLEAAEYWQSASMLRQAEPLAATALQMVALARAGDPDSGFNGNDQSSVSNRDVVRDATLQAMRIAVLRARLSRTPQDIDAAANAISLYAHPLTPVAAESAFGSGDDFCDWNSGLSGAEVLQEISADCDAWAAFISESYMLRAHVLLLMLADPMNYAPAAPRFGQMWPMARGTIDMSRNSPLQSSILSVRLDVVERLFLGLDNGEPKISEQLHRFQPEVDAYVGLRIAAAEAAMQRLSRWPEARFAGNDGAALEAQHNLRAALRWTEPPHQPNRFLQIARNYIELDNAVRRDDPERDIPHEAMFREWLEGNVTLVETIFGRRPQPN